MILTVHVKPNAKKDSIEWIDKDTAKIYVRALPERGKANESVIELLSKELSKSKSCLSIKHGHTTRIKQIEII